MNTDYTRIKAAWRRYVSALADLGNLSPGTELLLQKYILLYPGLSDAEAESFENTIKHTYQYAESKNGLARMFERWQIANVPLMVKGFEKICWWEEPKTSIRRIRRGSSVVTTISRQRKPGETPPRPLSKELRRRRSAFYRTRREALKRVAHYWFLAIAIVTLLGFKKLKTTTGFRIEAFALVYQSVDTSALIQSENVRLEANTVCERFRRLARIQLGSAANKTLCKWGLKSTADIGRIVMLLLGTKAFGKRPGEKLRDYRDVFDFDSEFGGESTAGLPMIDTFYRHDLRRKIDPFKVSSGIAKLFGVHSKQT